MPGPSSSTSTSPSKLAERFWSLARAMEKPDSADDPKNVVRHVLAILDALDTGETGEDLTANTVSFLALLHQSEAQGDLLYASPEQARGERMDERSLVFSIGVLIFEKLTGRHPFGADGNPRRLARIQKAEMASGVAYFQTISGPLRTILLKCMGPFPDERWRSVAELRQQLEAFVEDRSEARASRDLPALPAEDDDNDVTTFMKKPASPKALSVAAERESGRRPNSIAGPLPSAPPATLGLAAKVSWMLAGGAIAALAIWIVGGRYNKGGAEDKAVAKVAPAQKVDAPAATPTPIPAATTAAATPESAALPSEKPVAAAAPATPEPAPAAPEPAPAPEPAAAPAAPAPTVQSMPSPAISAPDPSAAFDIDVGGEAALAAALTCFSAERRSQTVDLGISLFYPRSGLSKKIFWGDGDISAEERQCLSTAMIGLNAGGAPDKPTTVNYNFFLSAERSRVRAHLPK